MGSRSEDERHIWYESLMVEERGQEMGGLLMRNHRLEGHQAGLWETAERK